MSFRLVDILGWLRRKLIQGHVAIHECRHCGEKFAENVEECRTCGAAAIATYQFG